MLPNLRNFNFWVIFTIDLLIVITAYYISYLIRFEAAATASDMHAFRLTLFWIVSVYPATFVFFKLYNGMWRYTSLFDAVNLLKAVVSATILTMVIVLLLHRFDGISRSVFIINGLLIFLLIGGFRICIRFLLSQNYRLDLSPLFLKGQPKNLLIVGAGSAAEKLIREIQENKCLKYQLIGLVDDDPAKEKLTLHGVPVLGPIDELSGLVIKYDIEEIAIAVPSASMNQMRRIIDACKKTGATYKTLPGIGDLIQGKVTVSKLREVRYEDLLKRSPIELDNDSICKYLTDKCILVTGGAGSIGSGLCYQIAAFSPQNLIILDRNESSLYELVLDIKALFPELNVIPVLAAVQNRERMSRIFSNHRPQVVFHAAAYKHVPMMENHPWEAIFNNVIGSRNVLQLCRRFGVKRCVMVSTDKAVRPTNVMGATKRLVELLTQSYATSNHTRFMAVRFGNVLGSVGSVLPLFKKQIASGGPVTVTDPRMTRFFMTIPEACSLILQSGAYGRGGEIFVLKMGTPVHIDDMARDLISLSGYRVGEDIEIRYTGLRPGEKLYEELITQDEGIRKTQHDDIMVLSVNDGNKNAELEQHIDALVAFAKQGDAEKIKQRLKEIIPEYRLWTESVDSAAKAISNRPTSTTVQPFKENLQPTSSVSGLNHIVTEDRLLLQMLSIDDEHENALPFEALPIPDWEKIIQSALKHNVAALLYLRLKRTGMYEKVPLKIAERLRRIYLYFVKVSMHQQYWVGKLLELLDHHGLPVLVLNGLHINENIYHNIAARPISNLHFLSKTKNLWRKHAIHNQINRIIRLGGLDISINSKMHYPNFDKKIHIQKLWQRAQINSIAHCKIYVPCPEDLLLHLCLKFVYFYQYRFSGIQTLCDIREILYQHGTGLNWNNILAESRKLSMSNAMGLMLILAKDLLNAPISAETILMFGPEDQFSFAKRFALKTIFDENYSYNTLPPHFLDLWESKSLLKKIRALNRFIFSSQSSEINGIKKNHGHDNIFQHILACKTRLTGTMENCVKTTTMMLAKDKELKDQYSQLHQNTLIWEWIYGNSECFEKITSMRK
jgi:FlaA1/EpsC-like NDP-sugar epimerase